MQNAKDSFYIALRNRLALLNPERVVSIRSVERPGIMVEEAEAPEAEIPEEVFVLRWTSLASDAQLPSILNQLTCEFLYASSGSQTNSGLDRGRALTEMDKELISILCPYETQKMNYTQTPAAAMPSVVFWTGPVFSPAQSVRDQLLRTATVTVYAFDDKGES